LGASSAADVLAVVTDFVSAVDALAVVTDFVPGELLRGGATAGRLCGDPTGATT
jgi:hypothetical protein